MIIGWVEARGGENIRVILECETVLVFSPHKSVGTCIREPKGLGWELWVLGLGRSKKKKKEKMQKVTSVKNISI